MPTFWLFGARWTAISRPCASNPRPFASFECSTNVEMLPSGSMRVTRAARVSVNSTLPSGIPTGPSAPSNPVLINTIGVPAATTPGMAVSTTRSVGTGSAGAAPPAAGAAAGSAGGSGRFGAGRLRPRWRGAGRGEQARSEERDPETCLQPAHGTSPAFARHCNTAGYGAAGERIEQNVQLCRAGGG